MKIASYLHLVAVFLSFGLCAHADVLELKSGKMLTGKYVGGTAGTIRFESGGTTQVIETSLGDGVVKLVLEYADSYPQVKEEKAKQLLKDYSALEQKLAKQRAAYLKKFAKVIPAAKALRLAQLENRLDLVWRMQLASRIPLVPTEGK